MEVILVSKWFSFQLFIKLHVHGLKFHKNTQKTHFLSRPASIQRDEKKIIHFAISYLIVKCSKIGQKFETPSDAKKSQTRVQNVIRKVIAKPLVRL